ncbi:MAG: hypothetical protein FWD86_03250, partial [Firmicutes bacterium]|nr:hypothetical protein [Bacillota bacterium]
MKTRRIIATLAIFILSLGIFAACDFDFNQRRHPLSDPQISTQLEIQIRRAYVQKQNDRHFTFARTYVSKYFGTFDGSSVIKMTAEDSSYPQPVWTEKIGGLIFEMTYPIIQVFNDGEFF